MKSRIKRFFWSVMAVLSSLLTIGLYLLLFVGLEGCNKFEIAKRKYSTNVVDTTYQTITSVVPKDSAVLVTRTDTTHVVITERQGRATVILDRTPKITTVRAICDTVVIEKKVPVYIKKQVWGVDPKFEKRSDRRLTLIKVLLFLMGCLILYIIVLRQIARSPQSPSVNDGTVTLNRESFRRHNELVQKVKNADPDENLPG